MVEQEQEAIDHTDTGRTCSDLPGDILEAVVSNLSALDLLSASYVSRKWLDAVRSSLHVRPRLFPWLILRCLPHPIASSYTIHALDPHSRTWLSLTRRSASTGTKSPLTPSFLHGSPRDLLYTLSLSQLVISRDPFGSSSRMEAKGPKIWRQDPVVAEIGRWVVMVGGTFMADFYEEEEEGAVEVYDKETGAWELGEPMPAIFQGSTYATWLSVAVSGKRLYVIKRKTGWISWFDPESRKWGPTCQLRLEPTVSNWAIGIVGKERLLLVGAGSEGGGHKGEMMVRAWEVEGDKLQVISNSREEMPREMVDRLYPNFDSLDVDRRQACSVEVCGTVHGGYMFHPTKMKNGMVMYQSLLNEEDDDRRVRRWEWVPPPATVGCNLMEKISVGCSPVYLHEVARCFL